MKPSKRATRRWTIKGVMPMYSEENHRDPAADIARPVFA